MRMLTLLCLTAWVAVGSAAQLTSSTPKLTTVTQLAPFLAIQNDLEALKKIRVVGDTSTIQPDHPVIQAVLDRWQQGSKPGKRPEGDANKIALCFEGGGMRGCVAAGQAAALNFLALNDAVDVVYGSSAGSMVAAYFVSRQYSGVQIYHDVLPAAGKTFLNKANLAEAAGIPLARLSRILSFSKLRRLYPGASQKRGLTEVLDLGFLLEETMGGIQQLDWPAFCLNEQQQPLRIVASDVASMKTILLSRGEHYTSLPALLRCIRASMLVPGVAGRLVGISAQQPTPFYLQKRGGDSPRAPLPEQLGVDAGAGAQGRGQEITPLADGFLTEPIPYRSAAKDGATHIIALRTRPDPAPMLLKASLYENVIAKRFFTAYGEQAPVEWLLSLKHQRTYAHDVLQLNEAALGRPEGIRVEGDCKASPTHVLPVASTAAEGVREVSQLEGERSALLTGMRAGARRVLTLFLPAMQQRLQQQQSPEAGAPITAADVEQIVEMMFPLQMLRSAVPLADYQSSSSLHTGC